MKDKRIFGSTTNTEELPLWHYCNSEKKVIKRLASLRLKEDQKPPPAHTLRITFAVHYVFFILWVCKHEVLEGFFVIEFAVSELKLGNVFSNMLSLLWLALLTKKKERSSERGVIRDENKGVLLTLFLSNVSILIKFVLEVFTWWQ